MLSNSLVAAALATCYVLVLVLQLNPTLPLGVAPLAPLVGTFGLFYAIHLGAVFYVLIVVGQLLAAEPFSPAWVSVRLVSWLSAGAATAGAALMWANLTAFTLVLEPATIERMTAGAVVLAGSAGLFTIVALARHYAGSGRIALAVGLVAVSGLSVAVPVAMRGRGMPTPLESQPLPIALEARPIERPGRVTILALDAASLDLITNATAEGRLPNFGRVLDAGAVMRLATLHPTSPEAVWAAVATGKLPQKNGVRSAGVYRLAGGGDPIQLLPAFCYSNGLLRLGFLLEQPYTSATLRAQTLWGILSTEGVAVGVVNWPLTYPAPAVRGYLISDRYARLATTVSGIGDPLMLYPPELRGETLRVMQAQSDEPAGPAAAASDHLIGERYLEPGRTDRTNDRLAEVLARTRAPQVAIVRYSSLDLIGHYFLRYALPSAFGDVTDEERRTLGPVLESHYALIDAAIGRAIQSLGPADLLLVVSGYGMEPLGVGERILERLAGDPDLSGTHDGAPDGFLMAYGASVAKGRSLRRASVVDVAPTVLYFLGLPIGRDMDGYARTDVFRPSFTEERPIAFIPTYDR
jgi:predicted AlkP superfamily phosphohydrolase/phosphomutase